MPVLQPTEQTFSPETTVKRSTPPVPPPAPPEVEIDAEFESELDEPEVMLEPDDTNVTTDAPGNEAESFDEISLMEDDTFSPAPLVPGQKPPGTTPELPSNPELYGSSTAQKIRQTLESTGDLKPQPQGVPAETFMVPPASLEEAQVTPEELDTLSDFEVSDDDSLDLDSEADTLDLGEDLLDDLDEE
jgi:hypothetical protein